MTRLNKSKNYKPKKLSQSGLQQSILKYFQKNPKKRLNAKQLKKKLKLNNSKDSIGAALKSLHEKSMLYPVNEEKYRLDRYAPLTHDGKGSKRYKGVVDMTKTGSAYIVCENFNPDIYVSPKSLNGAFDNDQVRVELHKYRGRRRPEGRIVEILKRANTHFIGTLQIYKNQGIVYVHHPKMKLEVSVRLDELDDAQEGDVVIVKILEYRDKSQSDLRGRIQQVFHSENSNDIEMSSILINSGFQTQFPRDVLEEVMSLDNDLTFDPVDGRMDFREVTTFTIDPVDAKDFDDAISVQEKNGQFEIGVHIADVSHFVPAGSALDKEAYERGNSVYLVDRVCPMLPEKLSNDLCSLRPQTDRFCFSVVYQLDENFNIKSEWMGKSVIHSNHRFSYKEASDSLRKGNLPYSKELKLIHRITAKLRKERFANGSLNFETDEIRFELNEEAIPTAIYKKEKLETNWMIEELMLLANKTVATFIQKKQGGQEIPFVYRVHDEPDPVKLEEVASYADALGFSFKMRTRKQLTGSINALASESGNRLELKLLEIMAIRAMAKAAYSTKNIGHFGLAFENYTHFTSPIRRYSDLLVHRILEQNLKSTFRLEKSVLESKCYHISNQERKAQEAERDSVRYKQAEFMQDKLGNEYTGRIGAVLEWGFWIVLDDVMIEGIAGFEKFNESFDLPLGKFKAVGTRSGRVFHMGQVVKVRVVLVDVSGRTVHFEIIDD